MNDLKIMNTHVLKTIIPIAAGVLILTANRITADTTNSPSAVSSGTVTMSGTTPITVFGTPQSGNGTVGSCSFSYIGYISYTRTVAQGWGWAPDTNSTTIFTAADGGGRTNTLVVYSGKNGDTGCGQTSVAVPNLPPSPKYRFTIYFSNNVPTTNYPIILMGFGS